MKVCILVCLVFAAGCQGNFLDGLKNTFSQLGTAFKTTFSQVGEQAKVVGQGLLDNLKTQGTALAGQALQSLLLGATSALSQPSGTGKRTLDALKVRQELESFIQSHVGQMQIVFHHAVDELTQLGGSSHSADLVELMQKVEEVTHGHNAKLNHLLQELTHGVTTHFAQALQHIPHQKRNAFTDLLGNVGQSVASFFQPHIQGLQQVVSALGQGVTQTAHQVQTTGQPHITAIQNSGAQLLLHGHNALSALKDAVTDILHQTLTNIQPHLTNIAQHASQIAVQSVGQLATNLGHSVLNALGAAATTTTTQQPL